MPMREATAADWPGLRPFFRDICAAGETFTYPLHPTEEEARAMWMPPASAPAHVVVAEEAGTVLGTAHMYANRAGNGAHVASASYMVDPAHQGRGAGRALSPTAWTGRARRASAASSTTPSSRRTPPALALYGDLGFEILGTLPEGFHHPRLGYVGLHSLHRALSRTGRAGAAVT
ncbi:N-acetyltransferase family protein [Streptomyces sp. CA-253872]|uniref:GNAT family N-acetyltransferase n=1 Tax=Streptomyces sp. CA-253872 TaxID=3240067 RepID=UPI003D8A1712